MTNESGLNGITVRIKREPRAQFLLNCFLTLKDPAIIKFRRTA